MRGAFYAQLPYAYDLDPAEPYSIDVRSNATHVYNGARAQFRGGPAVRGDTFDIRSASETPYEYAAATAEAPSPRMRWESDGTSSEYIAWRLSSTTDEDRESPVWGVWLETNASAVRLDWRVDGSWVEGPAVKAEEVVTMDVVGRYAVASTMRLGVTYVQRGELAGGLAWSSTAGEWIEIEDNTEGILQYQEGALLARVRLAEDADGDRITRISFPRSCALLDSADVPEALQGFRLKLDEGTAAPPTRYNLKCNIGPAVVLGHPHGRDSRDTYSPRRASATAANGMRMTHREGPTDYRRTITWQDQPEPWTYQALRDTAQPSSLYDSQDVPVFARGSMAATVAHLVSEWGADGVPVVYVPRWEPASGSVVYQTHRAGGSELATIEDEFIVEHAGLGDEQVNPLVRGGAINLQRLT